MTWAGYLLAPAAGEYHFRTVSDDGVQVFIDGARVIHNTAEQWLGAAQRSRRAPMRWMCASTRPIPTTASSSSG
ncbi:PA14 domain-containing protein [Aquabacterium sp.]|uniref:PA14 domain-containing protein n=1 Tax=Aquabacterium sp. TaxID=1872578 RepID=UPI003BB10521